MAPIRHVRKRWKPGDAIVRREVLRHGVWHGIVVIVIEDTPERLITFIPSRSPHGFPEGPWPTHDGRHAWSERAHWEGHGVLMIQAPDTWYAVWHFWSGPQRAFEGWYLNLQEPFRRTAIGYDTQDLELDVWVPAAGPWQLKDAELIQVRVDERRFTQEQASAIRGIGVELCERLDATGPWWDPSWRTWTPPPHGSSLELPEGWAEVPHGVADWTQRQRGPTARRRRR